MALTHPLSVLGLGQGAVNRLSTRHSGAWGGGHAIHWALWGWRRLGGPGLAAVWRGPLGFCGEGGAGGKGGPDRGLASPSLGFTPHP